MRSIPTQPIENTAERIEPARDRGERRRGLATAIALAAVVLAAAWQALSPTPGWPAVLLAAVPLGATAVIVGVRPRGRGLNLGLAAFLLSAGVGVWATHNRGQAWGILLLIVTSLLVYGAVAIQPIRRMEWVGALALAAAAGVAGVFLLSHDWVGQPAEFGWINRVGEEWMRLRPPLELPQVSPNIAAGIIAGLMPLGMLAWAPGIGLKRLPRQLVFLAARGMCVAGLVLSSSRGAWIALAAGAVIGVAWFAHGSRRPRTARWWQAVLLGLVILASCSWLALAAAARLAPALDAVLPGAASAQSRASLAGQSLDLLADFPFTGGGLGAFAVLFSRYVMVFPWFYYGYAHNLSLDVALSQGVTGLLAWIGIVCLSVQAAVKTAGAADPGFRRRLAAATLAGLVVTLVHGSIDDPFYASRGVVLLFLYPGVAAALGSTSTLPSLGIARGATRRSRWLLVGGAAAGLLLFALWAPVRSRWLSNLASVAMARAELADWPAGVIAVGRPIDRGGSVQRLLEAALRLDRSNRTACYRLGILALNRGDFAQAVASLEVAHQLDPDHRGVQKTLGYALVWSGDLERAMPLLREIPEAESELAFYASWWRTRGSPIQADRSSRMERLLRLDARSPADASMPPARGMSSDAVVPTGRSSASRRSWLPTSLLGSGSLFARPAASQV